MKVLDRIKFGVVAGIFQVVCLVLFGVFGKYADDADKKITGQGGEDIPKFYAMFQDVHVMIFAGFGFLMTFLKKYGYSSIGLNLFISAVAIQWATIIGEFIHGHNYIEVNMVQLLTSDFTAAAVLISFGAVLGKVGPLQLLIMAIIEVTLFKGNEYIGLEIFHAVDMGGSMFVHAFGAYFGLAVSRVIYTDDVEENANKEGSVYHSDIFSMIGTIFLWMFWPSFNSALAGNDERHRAVINTYYALVACTVTVFLVSSLTDKKAKFDMVHVQNSTLAGGVAVGTVADMMVQPWGAVLIGMIAGVISVLGFRYLTPFMNEKLHIHDTCGVNNLHGMPGVLAGIFGAITVSLATKAVYQDSLYEIFGQMSDKTTMTVVTDGVTQAVPLGRSALVQAGYQVAALVVTLAISVVGGIITGLILRIPVICDPPGKNVFEDNPYWSLPEGDEENPANVELKDVKEKPTLD